MSDASFPTNEWKAELAAYGVVNEGGEESLGSLHVKLLPCFHSTAETGTVPMAPFKLQFLELSDQLF